MKRTDYTTQAGGAALGARLRRLSSAIDTDATRVYATLGIAFEQRWFGVLNQLALVGPMTVSELGVALRITHVSVSQTRDSLVKAGIVSSTPHDTDARKRTLSLTRQGRVLVDKLQPLWRAFDEAAMALNAEARDVVAALDRLDVALEEKSLHDRILERLPRGA
jgi:DNA-binding MarR family transcriptional regulator